MTRWYQNAVIRGVTMPVRRRGDTSGQRWERLLRPLVPPDGDGRLFVELGCNAGYYLREARALGYQAVGVERDPVFVDQALRWEAAEPVGARIVAADIREWDIPACSVVLLACVHYWLTGQELRVLLRRLAERACYLVVMGKHKGKSISPPDRLSFLRRRRGWGIAAQTRTASHWAVLLRNPDVFEADTEEVYQRQRTWDRGHMNFFPAFGEYVRLVLSGQRFDPKRTAFYGYLRQRQFRYRETLMDAYRAHALSMREEGMQVPLLMRGDGLVHNGNHRLVIAHVLGMPRVICRQHST